MGFMDSLTSGWTGPSMLGAGMGLAGLLGSIFSQPKLERLDTRTPEQMAGIGRLQNPPQWTDKDIEAAARLASMEGSGQAASRGFQVPGGGMIGMPQTIASETALRQILGLKGENIRGQVGAAQSLAGSPGFTYRQRPSVFGQAMQAGQGFGSMIPQPMRPSSQTQAAPDDWFTRAMRTRATLAAEPQNWFSDYVE